MKRLLQLGMICCAMWFAAGCGGGGDGGTTPTDPPSRVQIAVNWPERSKAISGPSSALSLAVTLQGLQTNGGRVMVQNRGTNANAHTETYSADVTAPRQQYPFRVDFFAGENATGEVVATAGGSLTLSAQTAQVPDVALTGKIETVTVPEGQVVIVNEKTMVTAEAKDAEAHIVAVSPGSFIWNVTTGADRVAPDQDGLRGIKPGAALVTASVDGKTSAAVGVDIGQRVRWKQQIHTGPYDHPYTLRYLAFKTGSNSWVQVPTTPGVYEYESLVFSESGTYGWLSVLRDQFENDSMNIALRTTTETSQVTLTGYNGNGPNDMHTVAVTVLGKQAQEQAFISDGFGLDSMGTNTTQNLRFSADRSPTIYAVTTNAGIPTRMLVKRNVSSSVEHMDMDVRGAESFGFTPITVNGPEELTASLEFAEGGPSDFYAPYYTFGKVIEGGKPVFYLPPAAQLMTGDTLFYSASTKDAEGRTKSVTGGRLTMDFPSAISLPEDFYDVVPYRVEGLVVGARFPIVESAILYLLRSGPVTATISGGYGAWPGGSANFEYEVPVWTSLPGLAEFKANPSTQVTAYYRTATIPLSEYEANRSSVVYESKTAGVQKVVRSE